MLNKQEHLSTTLESLIELVSRTPGLGHCSGKLQEVAASLTDASATEAMLQLFTALHALPSDAQIDFVKTFYQSQEEKINKFLDAAEVWMPFWAKKLSLEHGGVECDGCGMFPLY